MALDFSRLDEDPSQISIDLLKERVEAVLGKTAESGSIWFADHYLPFPRVPANGEPLDIVFFGNFVRRFLESGNWTHPSYRIWVVSEAVRSVLVRLLTLPAQKIGVLPRSRLFAPASCPRDLPRKGEPFTLVFAGRVSATKNVRMLVETVHSLQMEYGHPVGLAICGDFDDHFPPDFGRRQVPPFRESILQLIGNLEWNIPPRLVGRKPPWDWLKLDVVNPVFAGLSTYIYEDFDVALAQARMAGWPALISDWGGHRQVGGAGVARIHPAFIGRPHESETLVSLKARNLAFRLDRQLRTGEWEFAGVEEAPWFSPEPLSLEEFDLARRQVIDGMGPDIHLIYRDGMDTFAETAAGRRFFEGYRALFSGKSESTPAVILVNDLNRHENPVTRHIPTICESQFEALQEAGEEVVFLPVREIHTAESVWRLAHARKVIVPFYTETLFPVIQAWTSSLGIDARIVIFANPEQDLSGGAKIRSVLRPGDRFEVLGQDREASPAVSVFRKVSAPAARSCSVE